ncbi:MAG: 30S ribosomal protein S17 [Planctomycetota bacterium]
MKMKKTLVGIVAGCQVKTLRVEIARRMKHPKYGKIIRGRTICHAHDEGELAKVGDTVEIIEAPPRSRMKRWDLVRVVAAAAVVAGLESSQT